MSRETHTGVDPQFLRPIDGFGRTAPLAFTKTFTPQGVPLEVRSNAQAAIDLAETTFGAWHGLAPALVSRDRLALLDVIVQDVTGATLPSMFVYRRHGPVFLAAAGACVMAVLLDKQHAVCFVPTLALDDPEWFRAHVNGCGLLAVSQRDRVPLHAAVVVWNECAFLLTGTSGTGKSTLAYACSAAGFHVLSEEAVFVSLSDGRPRLWGHAPTIWLDPGAVRFFPELRGQPVVTRASGKLRVAAAPVHARPLLTHAGPIVLIALERGGSHAAITPAGGRAWQRALAASDDEGFDQYPDERPALAAWLKTLPACGLDIGPDPHAAARLLKNLAAAHTATHPPDPLARHGIHGDQGSLESRAPTPP